MSTIKETFDIDLDTLKDLIDKSNDSVFICTPQSGRFIFANKKGCTSLGYDRREILRLRARDIELSFPDESLWQRHVSDVREKGTLSFEGLHKRKDGSAFPVEANISYVELKGQDFLVTIARDITGRRSAEEFLLDRERLHAESRMISHSGSWVHNLKTGLVSWSDEMFRLLGLDPGKDRADFTRFFEMVHPDDRPELRKAIDEALRKKKPLSIDYRFVRKNGEVRAIYVQAELVPDDAGDHVILSGTAYDITDRKKADESLREAEARLSRAQMIAHMGDWEWDIATNAVTWSDELYRIYGFEPGSIAPDYGLVLDQMHPSSKEDFLAAIDAALGQDRHFEMDYRFYRKDGTEAVLHTIGQVSRNEAGAPVKMVGTVQDLTAQKKAEEALRESESKFRSIFDRALDGIMIAGTEDRKILEANTAMCDLLGYRHDEILTLCIEDIHRQEDLPAVLSIFERQIRGDRSLASNIPMKKKDGTVLYADINASLMFFDRRQCIAGIFRNITERMESEEKIRQSEKFIRSILDTVDEGFIVIDRDYSILTANSAFCTQAESPPRETIGRKCYEISHKAERPCHESDHDCPAHKAFETGMSHTAIHRHFNNEGEAIYVEINAFPFGEDSGHVMTVIETINNITEKYLLEEERLKTQKLESIGTLAGGIAHDFNNLLQGIFGYISMARMNIDDTEKALTMLSEAENAIHQSVSLTKQLLTFSKGGKPVKKRLSLLPVIENATRFALSGSQSGFRLDLDPELWQVDADGGQMGQVIQNIVLNAKEAMREGGMVSVSARNIRVKENENIQLSAGRYTEITIQDSGIGIPEKNLGKIFDPYFTTKKKGNGLGLATSYSIIKNHGGVIEVASEPERGTLFRIYLAASETERAPEVAVPSAPAGRQGRILVMDDEKIVREIAGEFIRSIGHEADLADCGEAALGKFRDGLASGRPYDIVILDLTVRGGMGGLETLELLKTMDPGVKAVVSSGYSDDDAMSDFETYGFSARLGKPYRFQALRNTLNHLLS